MSAKPERSGIGLSIYNPHLLSKDDLVAQFCAREPLLESLITSISASDAQHAPQHHLIVGPRGMGKTTLLLRTRYEIENRPELDRRFMPLSFPEEQYNVRDLDTFWLNALDALADALEQRGELEEARWLDQLAQRLDRTESGRGNSLLELVGWARRRDRVLVLCVDNLDLVLERVDTQGQWALRKLISSEPRILIVGACAAASPDHFSHGMPFYDFFQLHLLEALSLSDATRQMVRLSEQRSAPRVKRALEQNPQRLKALHVLTGGSPRALATLFHVLSEDDDLAATEQFERVLDLATPYYKDIVESLSSQPQLIFDALARRWDPALAAEVAELAGVSVDVASSQLARLRKLGLISILDEAPSIARIESAPNRQRFLVSERLLNVWYLMRASRRFRTKLLWLVRFLESFYTPDELRNRLRGLMESKESSLHHAETVAAYAQATAKHDPALAGAAQHEIAEAFARWEETGRRISEIYDLDDPEIARVLEVKQSIAALRKQLLGARTSWPRAVTAQEFTDLVLGSVQFDLRRKQQIAQQLSALASAQVEETFELLRTETQELERLLGDKEAGALREAIRDGTLSTTGVGVDDLPHLARVAAQRHKAPPLEALGAIYLLDRDTDPAARKAVATKCLEARRVGWLLWWLRRMQRAGADVAECLDALEGSELYLDHSSWLEIAADQQVRREANECGRFALQAASLRAEASTDHFNVGYHAHVTYRDWVLAERAYNAAATLDSKDARPWNNLGNLLQEHLARYEESELAYRRAIELDPKYAWPWDGLGNLLQDPLARYEESERAYRRAIELDPKAARPWNGLGALLHNHLARYEEAESAFRRAIELDPGFAGPWNNLAWQLANRVDLPEDAVAFAEQAIRLDPTNPYATHTLAYALARGGHGTRALSETRRMFTLADQSFIASNTRYIAWLSALLCHLGLAREFGALLDETGQGERMAPLREAVRAFERGGKHALALLAPEVRTPAEEIWDTMGFADPRSARRLPRQRPDGSAV